MALGDRLRRLDQRLLPPMARALHRVGRTPVRFRAMSTIALFCAVVGAVTAAWAVERPATGMVAPPQMIMVGVTQGEPLAGYLAAADGRLARLAAAPESAADVPTYALVSFSAYLGAGRVRSVLGEVPVAEAFARVNLPGRATADLRLRSLRGAEDLPVAMREVAERRRREAAGYRARAGAERAAEPRRAYEQQAFVAEAEALAYRSGCSCFYAVVVRATPQALWEIARRPGVRAVDPAPEVWSLDRTVFSPPLPERADRASARRDRVPAGSHGPAERGAHPRPAPALTSPAPGSPGPSSPAASSPASSLSPPSPDRGEPAPAPAPSSSPAHPPAAGPDTPDTSEQPPATADGAESTPDP